MERHKTSMEKVRSNPVHPIRPCKCDTSGVIKAVWGENVPRGTSGVYFQNVDTFNLRILRAETVAYKKGASDGIEDGMFIMFVGFSILTAIVLAWFIHWRIKYDK